MKSSRATHPLAVDIVNESDPAAARHAASLLAHFAADLYRRGLLSEARDTGTREREEELAA